MRAFMTPMVAVTLWVPTVSPVVWAQDGPPERRLVWVDRDGNASSVTETLGDWETPRLSPDGKRLAVRKMVGPGGADQFIWILDLSRGTSTQLTTEEGYRPVWSPDGERVFFASRRVDGSTSDILSQPADGRPAEPLTSGIWCVPSTITSDGKTLVFRGGGDARVTPSLDVGMVRLGGDGDPEMVLETAANEHTPKLSPDDRWLAYVSDESGRDEIYVTRFPPDGKWQISTEGGKEPLWSRDGRELFYRNGEKMMLVDVSAGPQSASKPTVLFEGPYDLKMGSGATNYDVAPDGRFVMIQTEAGASAP